METDKLKQAASAAQSWYQSHAPVVKGLIALLLGGVCIFNSYKLIIHFSVFILGLYFIYFGLTIFRVTAITDLIDNLRCNRNH